MLALTRDGKVLGWGSNQPDFIQIVPKKPGEYLLGSNYALRCSAGLEEKAKVEVSRRKER
jgi:hypothetical protein